MWVWPQEIVENSFSRTSWLSVWKARFLRTLVLIDRTWERMRESGRAQAERKKGDSWLQTPEGSVQGTRHRPVFTDKALWRRAQKSKLPTPNSERFNEESSRLCKEVCPWKTGVYILGETKERGRRKRMYVCSGPYRPQSFPSVSALLQES